MKHFNHRLLVDFHHGAIAHGGCGAKAERLPCKATFSEEIALVQNAYCGFLPDLRHNGESYLPFLYIKNSIGRVALSKDRLPFGKSFDLSTAVDGRKECLGIEFDEFLGRCHECHNSAPLSRVTNPQKQNSYDVRMNECERRGEQHQASRGAKLRSAR